MPLSFTIFYGHAHAELACQNVFNAQTPILVTAKWESKYVAEMCRGSNVGWLGKFQTVITRFEPIISKY